MYDDQDQTKHRAVSLYYFHIKDGIDLLRDLEGSAHPSLQAARIEAIEGARQLISDAVLTGIPVRLDRAFHIEDADGQMLLRVPFTDAIDLTTISEPTALS
jgi:hypothetical protein